MENKMTWKQKDRQRGRSADGRYAEHNPCYRCGKSAGSNYFSGPFVDRKDPRGQVWSYEMLCVCEPCGAYLWNLADTGDLDRINAEVGGGNWGWLPQGKARKETT